MEKIEIYSSPFCGYCHAAKRLLAQNGLSFKEYDVMYDAERKREMVARSGGRYTVPQIFVEDVHVGGFDDLSRLDAQDRLNALLSID